MYKLVFNKLLSQKDKDIRIAIFDRTVIAASYHALFWFSSR